MAAKEGHQVHFCIFIRVIVFLLLVVTRIAYMDTRDRVKAEIEKTEGKLIDLKAQGKFLSGVRVERTAAGGTASQKAQEECRYARLRAGKGKLLDNGKKSKYIPVREIDKYLAMCNRGKAIERLERKLKQQKQKLRRLNAIAAKLGL